MSSKQHQIWIINQMNLLLLALRPVTCISCIQDEKKSTIIPKSWSNIREQVEIEGCDISRGTLGVIKKKTSMNPVLLCFIKKSVCVQNESVLCYTLYSTTERKLQFQLCSFLNSQFVIICLLSIIYLRKKPIIKLYSQLV